MARYCVKYWEDITGEWMTYTTTDSIISACTYYTEALGEFSMAELVDVHTGEILEGYYGDENNKITMVNICTEETYVFPDKGSDDANMTYIVKEILEVVDLCPNPYWEQEWKRYHSMRLRSKDNCNHTAVLTLGKDGMFVLGEYWCK